LGELSGRKIAWKWIGKEGKYDDAPPNIFARDGGGRHGRLGLQIGSVARRRGAARRWILYRRRK
jgi:hypothetical protein